MHPYFLLRLQVMKCTVQWKILQVQNTEVMFLMFGRDCIERLVV